jgi:hypothetical protein
MRITILAGSCVALACCGGETSNEGARPTQIEVTWGERTCPGPYAEGPYAAEEVLFGKGKANIPLPPVFPLSKDSGVLSMSQRTDVDLDGTPLGQGLQILSCGVALEAVTRVTGTSPLAVERDFTWTGTRSDPCNTDPPPPPSSCHVVQRVVYPVDAPDDAGP